jgi:hypothetical protein
MHDGIDMWSEINRDQDTQGTVTPMRQKTFYVISNRSV